MNFGKGITRFGVVVETIRNFEVSGLFLWIFLSLGTFLELFFKFLGLTVNSWTVGYFQRNRGAQVQNVRNWIFQELFS
jgi:hypothetical protein